MVVGDFVLTKCACFVKKQVIKMVLKRSSDIVVLDIKADFYALKLGVKFCFFCFINTKCRSPPVINLNFENLVDRRNNNGNYT